MKPILVIYATREGHTWRIAEHVCRKLEASAHAFEILDATQIPEGFDFAGYSAAIIGASIHGGVHEWEVVAFVKRHLAELRAIPTLFLSVGLSQKTAEDPHAPAEKRGEAAMDVRRAIDRFLAETGWKPTRISPVAGALKYSMYGFVTRFFVKEMAEKIGAPVDTSRDYQFTDWKKLDETVEQFVRSSVSELVRF